MVKLSKSSDSALDPIDNVIGNLFSTSYRVCNGDGGVDVQHVGDEHQYAEVGKSLVGRKVGVFLEVITHIAFAFGDCDSLQNSKSLTLGVQNWHLD